MEKFKKFGGILKNYINYIMKLGFKDLFINFIELIILVIISTLVLFPIELVKGLLYQLFGLFINESTTFYQIYNLLVSIVGVLLVFMIFIYLFNKRYEDIEKLREDKVKEREEKMYKTSDEVNELNKKRIVEEDFDLPKPAEKKRL